MLTIASPSFILTLHLASTLFMTGLIWFVQLVHYPLFASVPAENFPEYESKHQNRTTLVVVPPMVIELSSGMYLFFQQPWSGIGMLAFGLLILIWLSTFFVQVPLHGKLEQAYNLETIQKLVTTNWIRTIAWTVRAALLLFVAGN